MAELNHSSNRLPNASPDALPVALITGASQRIGKAITERLHDMGYCVVIHFHRSENSAKLLAEKLNRIKPDSAITIPADLSKEDELNALVNTTKKKWNRLDLLVNNASVFEPDSQQPDNSTSEKSDTDKSIANKTTLNQKHWQKVMDTNIRAAWWLADAFKPFLQHSRGGIINLVDIYSERPLKSHTVYSISKAGIAMLTKSLALEFAPDIRVNGISPGAILWPSSADTVNNDIDENYQQQILNKIPLARLGSTKAITETVRYLIQCDYISGQIIQVDGGRSLTI